MRLFRKSGKTFSDQVAERRHWIGSCNLGTRLLRTKNISFDVSTFEIAYRQNFFKSRKLTLFDAKCPHLRIRAQNFWKHVSDFEISTFETGYIWNFAKIRKSLDFWSKMPKFQHLGSKFSKFNVRSKPKINTFVIGYRQNFVKFRKLIHFDPKCQYLEIWVQNIWKPISDLK